MGFFSKVKSTLKKAGSTVKKNINKFDRKVGGVLPGGPTPTEVKASKADAARKRQEILKDPSGPNTSKQPATQASFSRAKNDPKLGLLTETKGSQKGGFIRDTFSGVKSAFGRDPAGRDFETLPLTQQVGKLGTEVATIASLSPIATAIESATVVTAVSSLEKVGKTGLARDIAIGGGAGTAGTIAVNTATKKKTAAMLTGAAATAGVSNSVVPTAMAAIGSYPFAGFIREEALQTISFAIKSALDHGDFAGADEAIAFQKELLNPDLWHTIVDGVPFVNVQKSLNAFYKAASIKLRIDERVLEILKEKDANGETDTEMYARIEQERFERREQERIDDAAYYASITEQRLLARAEERLEDERYYARIEARREEDTRRKRKEAEDYYSGIFRELDERRAGSAPSNLQFGLL